MGLCTEAREACSVGHRLVHTDWIREGINFCVLGDYIICLFKTIRVHTTQ